MRYLVRWKDADGQDQEKSFARKTERTKWVRKQQKLDPMVKYNLTEESEMSEQDTQVEQFEVPAVDGVEVEQVTEYGEDDVPGSELEDDLEAQVPEPGEEGYQEYTQAQAELAALETPMGTVLENADGSPVTVDVKPKAEKSPMAGKTVKVRLTMTAEVDYDTFKARYGLTDDALKNYALHELVRGFALEQLEEFGRTTQGETVTYWPAKQ